MRKTIAVLVLALLVSACSPAISQTEVPTATVKIKPSLTPNPTNTPLPTPTEEPIPEPVVYEGTGDTFLAITKPIEGDMCLMFVQGNEAGEFFGLVAYDADGNLLHKLIITEEPYVGTRLLDGSPDKNSASLDIRAVGPWIITLFPIIPPYIADYIIDVPKSLSGNGDVVIITRGQSSSISANYKNEKHFVIFVHGTKTGGLVFNKQGAFTEEALLPENTVMLEIMSEGDWDINIK
jgi:hypothetical protein